jgi:hypothetical protein
MAFATAALAILSVVKRVQAELIANDVSGLDPQMEKCVKSYFSNTKHSAEMAYAFGVDTKRKLTGTKKRDGKLWYSGAGVKSADLYEKALKQCGAHPITIELSRIEWYEAFGNKWSQQFAKKRIVILKQQLAEQAAAAGGGGATGGTSIPPAMIAAGLVIAYLMLKK